MDLDVEVEQSAPDDFDWPEDSLGEFLRPLSTVALSDAATYADYVESLADPNLLLGLDAVKVSAHFASRSHPAPKQLPKFLRNFLASERSDVFLSFFFLFMLLNSASFSILS